MTESGYEVHDDPDCYVGTVVLKNKAGLRSQAELDQFEALMVASRLSEPLPTGQLDVEHYRAIHRHLFQDVYAWAGRDRQIRTHKGDTTFCFPENIGPEMRRLFDDLAQHNHLRGLDRPSFARAAAKFIGDLNAIHPFREGNGRVQQTFLVLLADQAGHAIDLSRVRKDAYLRAMISAYAHDEALLAAEIESWMIP